MGILGIVKSASRKLLSDNVVLRRATASITEVLSEAEGASAEFLGSSDLFRERMSDPLYNRLPALAQELLNPDQWHQLVWSTKDSLFRVEGKRLRLQPEVKASVREFLLRLVYGEKWKDHQPDVVDVTPEDDVPVSETTREGE